MDSKNSYDLIVIGGGLAGLSCALRLSKVGCRVLLLEKNPYPHHKVCGEYVSNEILPYLNSLGIDPFERGAVSIDRFEVSSIEGKTIRSNLPLGGFGISRYALDNLLYEKLSERAEVHFETVENLSFLQNEFTVSTLEKNKYRSKFVVGAFGKRSSLDVTLKRNFIRQKSPWLGVKAHYEYEFPGDLVALHNFRGGYCGLSQVETGLINACYLATYSSFRKAGSPKAFKEKVLIQNPHLQQFFSKAVSVFPKPLTIAQISFERKRAVEGHIYMIGDSAGLIHPLCGNGMAMAIHAAKLFCDLYLESVDKPNFRRVDLERNYRLKWEATFSRRLQTGRMIQRLFLNPATANMGMKIARIFPSVIPKIISKTHGDVVI